MACFALAVFVCVVTLPISLFAKGSNSRLSCSNTGLPEQCQWSIMPASPRITSALQQWTDTSKAYMLAYPPNAPEGRSPSFVSCFLREFRKPLYTAEVMTRNTVGGFCTSARKKCARPPFFHTDHRLCLAEQDDARCYSGSGFDRGHLTPNAEWGDHATRNSTFAVTNIVPQTADRNQNVWRQLEEDLRDLILPPPPRASSKFDRLFVYTAVAYTVRGKKPLSFAASKRCNNPDMVFPYFMYKVVICTTPKQEAAIMACWSDNPAPATKTRDSFSSSPTFVQSPLGEHISKCPEQLARQRCLPISQLPCHTLSDECFQPIQNLTAYDVVEGSGLQWQPVVDAVRKRYANFNEHATCFDLFHQPSSRKQCSSPTTTIPAKNGVAHTVDHPHHTTNSSPSPTSSLTGQIKKKLKNIFSRLF